MSFSRMDLEDRKRPKGRNAILVYGYSEEGVQTLKTIRSRQVLMNLSILSRQIVINKSKKLFQIRKQRLCHPIMNMMIK